MSHDAQGMISRRKWLELTAVSAVAMVSAERASAQRRPSSSREDRIRQLIEAYEEQGFHRTGTPVDLASANWLRDEVGRAGLTGTLEPFSLNRVEPVTAEFIFLRRRFEGLPLSDGAFTDAGGVRGPLRMLIGKADIGVTEVAPNAAGAGPLGDARRANRHKAIICATRGARPGLCPSNADSFLAPFGPPVLQVSSEHAAWLTTETRHGAEVQVIAHVRRTPAEAFNVTARIAGTNPALPPLVIMTPRSGWYRCASERGGGIAVWLELMRALREATPAREVLFVASSGHELGHLGINAFVDRRPGIVTKSIGWIHLGANIGAAGSTTPQTAGNRVQASDDEMERMLVQAVASTAVKIDVRVPRGRVPGGEAEVVHRGGGRYVSVIGSNPLFHNPADRGPEVIDARAISAFVDAFGVVARTLAGPQTK